MNGEMDASETMPAQSPAAGQAAIEVAHLIKLYKTTRAVDDVSFRIARGSVTGLLKTGRNAEARALLDQQLAKLPGERRGLPWFLMVRGMSLDERPSGSGGIQPLAERGR